MNESFQQHSGSYCMHDAECSITYQVSSKYDTYYKITISAIPLTVLDECSLQKNSYVEWIRKFLNEATNIFIFRCQGIRVVNFNCQVLEVVKCANRLINQILTSKGVCLIS